MQDSAKPQNVREIGKALGVATILEGSVRRIKQMVRVNLQLISTVNEESIWAEQYDRELTNVFEIERDLALRIAAALRTKLSPAEKSRLQERPTQNGEAYLAYLEVRSFAFGAHSVEELEKGAQLFERATELDPTFALAFATLSYVENTLYQATGDQSWLKKAYAAATESINLQPDLPEAHLALGYHFYRAGGEYEKALRELSVAKMGLPNDSDVFLVTGSIERRRGNWSQSIQDLKKAASLNPKNPTLWANLGTTYWAIRDYFRAARAFEHGESAAPSYFMDYWLRARLEIEQKGDLSLLEALVHRNYPEGDGEITLARFQLKLLQRKYSEALEILNKTKLDSLLDWEFPTPTPRALLMALTYQLLGEPVQARAHFEEACRTLEKAVRENNEIHLDMRCLHKDMRV